MLGTWTYLSESEIALLSGLRHDISYGHRSQWWSQTGWALTARVQSQCNINGATFLHEQVTMPGHSMRSVSRETVREGILGRALYCMQFEDTGVESFVGA